MATTTIAGVTPKIGGTIDGVGHWTGGAPVDNTWSASERDRPKTILCYRNGINFRQYQARVSGLSTKLSYDMKDGMTLQIFASKVRDHLENHGMDGVFYIFDDNGNRRNVISEYPLFTTSDVVSCINQYGTTTLTTQSLYDDYDKDNLVDSRIFLLDSIDSTIELRIAPFLTSNSTGPEIWMRIVSEIQSSSVERLIKIGNDIKNMKLVNFTGENVKQYSVKMIGYCRDLENGQSLPRDIVLTILDQLLDCKVEKFRMQFMTLRPRVLEEMRVYHGKDNITIRNLQILNKYVTYDSLLETANQAYQTMLDLNQWTSDVKITDSGSAPSKLYTAAEANTLVQKALAKFKQNNMNHTSGVSNNNTKNSNNNNNGNRNNNNNNRTQLPKNNWRFTPPTAGTAQTKSVNGTEYHWCAKCNNNKGRWSPSHGTSDHKITPTKPNGEVNNIEIQAPGLYCNWTSEINLLELRRFKIKRNWFGNVYFGILLQLQDIYFMYLNIYYCIRGRFYFYYYLLSEIFVCLYYLLKFYLRDIYWDIVGYPEGYHENLKSECNVAAKISVIDDIFTDDISTFDILWDTGATITVTPHIEDFINGIDKSIDGDTMKGIGEDVIIKGKGKVIYRVLTNDGTYLDLACEAFYMPSVPRRIFSPQMYFATTGTDGTCTQNGSFISVTVHGKSFDIFYDPRNNLPIFKGSLPSKLLNDTKTNELNVVLTDVDNQNLSSAQKLLLSWHNRLGHFSFFIIQMMLKSGIFGNGPSLLSAGKCTHPLCASCQYGKQHRRSTGSTTTTATNLSSLKQDDLFPGQRISVDHFSVAQKGRLFTSRGRTSSDLMYTGGCLFCDHASGYVFVDYHVHQNSSETLLAKSKFEQHLFEFGVTVQTYHTDNGIFKSQDFVRSLVTDVQSIRYSGPGAHHQNGVTERNIGTIFRSGRTMMIHAAIRWDEVIDICLWPMVLSYATWIFNRLPKLNGISPMELLTRGIRLKHDVRTAHVFGCPIYVLDPNLQNGHFLPKFSPRSRRGVFVGFSHHHSSLVPLVLNLSTLSITPQFHVIFDDTFSTVGSTYRDDPLDPIWLQLFDDSRYRYVFDPCDDIALDPTWDLPPSTVSKGVLPVSVLPSIPPVSETFAPANPSTPTTPLLSTPRTPTTSTLREQQESPSFQQHIPTPESRTSVVRESRNLSTPITREVIEPRVRPTPSTPIQASVPITTIPPTNQTPVRRSIRQRTAPVRYGYDGSQGYGYPAEVLIRHNENEMRLVAHVANLYGQNIPYHHAVYYTSCNIHFHEGIIEHTDPGIYMKLYNKPLTADTYRYHEAMCQPDWDDFKIAAETEIRTLEKMQTWSEVDRLSVPSNKKVLGGTWVFKRKRAPDGTILKHKARFCVRGDQQVAGVDYFETYAPVTMWSTVRTMFVLALIADLATVQVDYTNAFAQATLTEDVYIEIPTGFEHSNNIVLKLNKSLYGLVQAPRTFYEFLTDNLKKFGFHNEPFIDPCLWINNKRGIICVIWVDDCLFFAKEKSIIIKFIKDIEKIMPLTQEDTVTAFLGIKVVKDKSKLILTQPKLIQQILKAASMTDCNSVRSPAETSPLGSDVDGEPFSDSWEYASIVGMLMYLGNNTRPDIAFATHQCARFTHNPKQTHGVAVKRIIRYLKGTSDKGIILNPSNDLSLDCYVDADFAGLYGHEDPQNPISVKSRTGYVILLADCPVLWISKLQSLVACSTMEAEYVALSQAVKDLIPLRRLTKLACTTILGKGNYTSRMYSKIFEDNNGALQLARAPRITPRTKHYGIRYHFFREFVDKGDIKLFKVDTKEQRGDMFTKGLTIILFEHHRLLLMGW